MKKLILICLAIFAGLFFKSEICFAGGYWVETESEIYSTVIYNYAKFIRADSGWAVSTGGSAFIPDSGVKAYYSYASCDGLVQFKYMLPKEVSTRLSAGDNVIVSIKSPGTQTTALMSYLDYEFSGKTSLTYRLKIVPVIANKTINNFVSGLSVCIPIVPDGFGYNLFKVYPTIGSEALAQGYYSRTNTSEVKLGYIHPSIIKNANGAFVSGSKIEVNGELKGTTFYTIGKSGSFANGNACTLVFACPVKLVFSVKSKYYVTVPDTPKPPVVPDVPDTPDQPDQPDEPDGPDTPIKPRFTLRIHRII